jgi:2,3-bisphosphoglycerate-dependent phosphoglycerate mutase
MMGSDFMLELIIARHGQSVADIEKRHEGRADFPLTNLGKEQAEKLAHWLKDKAAFDYIISSPLKRAAETSEIVSKTCGKEIFYDERLMEWNNGVLAGLLRSEAQEKYPIPEGGRKYFERIPEGESIIEFRARVEEFFAELLDRAESGSGSGSGNGSGNGNIVTDANESTNTNRDSRILIIAHGGTINMLFQSFLGLPVKNDIVICSGDTGVHVWRVNGGNRTIIMSNGNAHLR